MCTLKLQFTILNIQVRSDRPALLPCRIRLVCYAQDELLHLLELLFKVQRKFDRCTLQYSDDGMDSQS
jgi:hypothetical protein